MYTVQSLWHTYSSFSCVLFSTGPEQDMNAHSVEVKCGLKIASYWRDVILSISYGCKNSKISDANVAQFFCGRGGGWLEAFSAQVERVFIFFFSVPSKNLALMFCRLQVNMGTKFCAGYFWAGEKH